MVAGRGLCGGGGVAILDRLCRCPVTHFDFSSQRSSLSPRAASSACPVGSEGQRAAAMTSALTNARPERRGAMTRSTKVDLLEPLGRATRSRRTGSSYGESPSRQMIDTRECCRFSWRFGPQAKGSTCATFRA